ncbi:hypothetical protein [Lewinella sp. IMCC34183]|uniref:hypothetical protein n=1 Tax=Lewinella sp. IMCC34183 TaxID=2248762 RepID=UPI000E2236A7|nr:hypothetical protein [Lewinella sp. IMCC34183]
MNVFGRYVIYLLDCLVMLAVIGLQLFLFRGEFPFGYDSDQWLSMLLGGHGSVALTTLIGGTAYWYIVDYHAELRELRRSRIVMEATGEAPPTETRFLRSFLKAFSLFTAPVLLLFALFSDRHRFLHDYVAKTERVH